MQKLKNFIEYFQYLKNPIEALQFKFGIKKEYEIKIKNSNCTIKLNNIIALNRLMFRIPIIKKEKYPEFLEYINDINNNQEITEIDNIKYINIYNDNFVNTHPNEYIVCTEEYFSDDQWDMLNLKNRDIIDIGANNADTALYFAKNGSRVIAFEPVKHIYELGLENIKLNPSLKDKIQYINKAVGAKKGLLNINAESLKDYADRNDSYDIEVITVSDILNDYDFPADILKMDCEGCEFEIILNEDLTMFNEIVFEHHSKIAGKDYKSLIEKLEKDGFKIDTYEVAASKQSFDDIGIIHAYK